MSNVEKIHEYELKIQEELKSSSRDMNTIIYWQLCIIDIKLSEIFLKIRR